MMDWNNPIETWAAWRKDKAARAMSASGGLAAVISEQWINEGGVVYGAAFVKPFEFRHIRCSSIEELQRLKGSKYVQSSINGIHEKIEEDLKNGRKVLFTGTPCQVAGICTRFKQYKSQLYCIDIICHGTPTVQTLRDSISPTVFELEFDRVEFRKNNQFQFVLKKNDEAVWSRALTHDLYLKGFFKAIFYRDCCYKCSFARVERISDLTLGDFWGIDQNAVSTSAEEGISLVLVNTEKGKELLDSVKDQIEKVKRPLQEAVSGNQQLQHPMPLTWRHKVFKRLYPKIGFKWAAISAMPDIVLKNLLK